MQPLNKCITISRHCTSAPPRDGSLGLKAGGGYLDRQGAGPAGAGAGLAHRTTMPGKRMKPRRPAAGANCLSKKKKNRVVQYTADESPERVQGGPPDEAETEGSGGPPAAGSAMHGHVHDRDDSLQVIRRGCRTSLSAATRPRCFAAFPALFCLLFFSPLLPSSCLPARSLSVS